MFGSVDRATIVRLAKYMKKLWITVFVLTGVAVMAAILVSCSEQGGDLELRIATTASILGTYAALIVALLVFEWTADAKLESDGTISEIAEGVDKIVGHVSPVDDSEPSDIRDESLETPLGANRIRIAGVDYFLVGNPEKHDLAWWGRLIRRIQLVGDAADHQDKDNARLLLETQLSFVTAVGFLVNEQAGNRRTLLVVEKPGEPRRIWSVFSGKGRHVRDETSEAVRSDQS